MKFTLDSWDQVASLWMTKRASKNTCKDKLSKELKKRWLLR